MERESPERTRVVRAAGEGDQADRGGAPPRENGTRAGKRRPPRAPSVRLLAEELQVSIATVSRALNNHPEVSATTRRRVVDAALRIGYSPTAGSNKASNVLGLLMPEEQPDDFGGFEAAVISGILRVARGSDFDVAFVSASMRDATESYTKFFLRKGISGALLRGADAPRAAEELTREGLPCVVIANRSSSRDVSFVDAESRSTSRQAVEHLAKLGHRRIGLGTHVVADTDHVDRFEGYRDGLASAGLPYEEGLVVKGPVDQRGGELMLERLLKLPDPPTAIYLTNPLTTIGALLRCAQLSIRVPDELSIVGVDDTDVRHRAFPAFTAVCQDAAGIAVDATRWLIARVEGRASGAYRVMRETEFNVEESTGLAPLTRTRLDATGAVVRASS